LSARGTGEDHFPRAVHVLPDDLQGPFVFPHRHEQPDDAQLTEIHREGPIPLGVDLGIDPFRAQVVAEELRLEVGGGAVDLRPALDDAYLGMIGTECRPSLAGAACLAEGTSTHHAAVTRLAVRMEVAHDRFPQRTASGAGISSAVLLTATLAHVDRLVGDGLSATRTLREVVRELRVTRGTLLHWIPVKGKQFRGGAAARSVRRTRAKRAGPASGEPARELAPPADQFTSV